MSDFIIPLSIQDEQTLYSSFDPSGLSLSSEITDYLSDYIEERRLGERVCLEVTTDSTFDTERFRKAYLLFMQKQQRRNRREIVSCNLNAVRLLLIGIIFIVIGIVFAPKMKEIIAAIISTIGSFSVWEASAHWIEALPELRKKERVLNLLSEAEMRVKKGEENDKT